MSNQTLLQECNAYEEALKTARLNLAYLKQQAAVHTAESMPPRLQINMGKKQSEITELERKVAELKAQLNGNVSEQEQQKKTSVKVVKKTAKIKPNIMKGYNLDTLIYELCQPIRYEGAFAFTLGGHREILDNYVIERIYEALQNKTRRPWKRHDITIYISDLGARELIVEERLRVQKVCQDLGDLLDARKREKADTLLIVWNHEIPLNGMSEIAVCSWQDVEHKSRPFLIGKSCCLVLIWANTVAGIESSLDNFIVLPVPHEFGDLEDLTAWFGGELEQVELSDEQKLNKDEIEGYKERIKSHHGHLVGTYTEIQRIIQELRSR